jgi:hypothetical protein
MEATPNHVDADDPVVGGLLRETVELVRHHGGHLVPGTVLVERDHHLSIEFRDDQQPDGPIITVPEALLVPVGGIVWDSDEPRPAGGQDALAGPALRSLDLLAALYGACDSLGRFAALSPRVAAGSDPLLEHALAATQRAGAKVSTTEVVPAFIASRVLASSDPAEPATRRRILMPLIDAANHDHEGAPFRPGRGGLRFDLRRPLGTAECFASYGAVRDPLDLALHYGFVSTRSPTANSVPTIVEIGGGRTVRVLSQRTGRSDAPNVSATDDELVVSNVTFRRGRPRGARAELNMAVSAWVLRDGGTEQAAERLGRAAWDGIVRANLEALAALRRASGRRDDTVGEILGTAIDLQVAIILDCVG